MFLKALSNQVFDIYLCNLQRYRIFFKEIKNKLRESLYINLSSTYQFFDFMLTNYSFKYFNLLYFEIHKLLFYTYANTKKNNHQNYYVYNR